ncbi:MAG TPA: VOC family protein [Polyangia bacterium]
MKLVPDGVHHAAIQVRDLAAAERFYVGVLGLPVLRRWPSPAGGERSLWVGAGPRDGGSPSPFLALEVVPATDGQPTAAEEPARAGRPGHHLLALRIARSERAAWESRLAAAGVPITARSDFTLYFSDPEGNRLGLSHFPDAVEPI